MARKYNVLVFPAGTEIAFEIHASLRGNKLFELYGATSEHCHADFVFRKCIDGLPYANDPAVIDALNEIIDYYNIDFVYPAHDSALLTLTVHKDDLHAQVVTSQAATVAICRSKKLTYSLLHHERYCPKVYSGVEYVEEYPVFVKPAVGQGSVGARKVESSEELRRILSDGTDYVICEYLPGKEYTVDCFTDMNGKLRYVGQRTRERIRAGIAVRSRFVKTNDFVNSMADHLNHVFTFDGAWFFQVKEDKNGEPKLMEVAPRIAGTMGLSRNRGVNLPLLTLYNLIGENVEICPNSNEILLDRAFISRYKQNIYYDCVYVDLDDTLIIDGTVNPILIAFLHQCKNEGISVCLLTKHAGSIYRELADYCIDPGLFSLIINVAETDEKWRYIYDPHSIFIDDSFSERKKVKENQNIPVFDISMVDGLIDWTA